MSSLDALIPIIKGRLIVGQPIPYDIYDAWGTPWLVKGTVIDTVDLLNEVMEDGYCIDTTTQSVDTSTLTQNLHPKSIIDQVAVKIPSPSTPPQASMQSAITAPATPKSGDAQNKESLTLDLDAVRWNVGEPFYLQVHDNPSIRYTVKLIGYVKNKSILVTEPTVDGKGALIREGQTFIVRSFPGKKAYAFTASSLKSVFSPHAYLHLSYPKIVRCTTIRQGSRATVKIIASLSVGSEEQATAMTLHDMSMGGTSGIVKRAIGEKNDAGTIKFKVNTAGEDAFLTLAVIVRSIMPTENSEELRYGLEFVDLSVQSKLILSSFVHQTLAETE